MRSIARMACLALLSLVLAACSSTHDADPAPTPTSTDTASPASDGSVTKVLVFIVENHSLAEMSSAMPYTYGLAERYGYATHYRAVQHPSLPDYLAIAGGSTFGVTDDDPPAAHPVHGRSVFGQALALGKTAGVYADGMVAPCALVDGGDRYAVRHNPWAYFVDERRQCEQYDVPLTGFDAAVSAGALPDVGMVVPNTCHDAHDPDCDLADADAWLHQELDTVLAGPDFRSGDLAVVVTADEDDHSQGNLVLTTVLHPSQHGHVVAAPLTHFSLTRLYDQVLGAPLLNQARTAPDLAAAFALPLGH